MLNLFKKCLLSLSAVLLALLIFEFFVPFPQKTLWKRPNQHHPLNAEAVLAVKKSPYQNWKHSVQEPPNFDFTKRYKVITPDAKFFEPNTSIQARLYYQGQKESIYSASYSFNSEGFRNVPASSFRNSKINLMFMGCSFTFGAGLSDEETFANHFAEMNPSVGVINFGTPGDGPNNFLHDLQNPSPRVLAQKKPIDVIVYTALDDLIERSTCSFDYCIKRASYSEKYLLGPMYRLDQDNQIKYMGSFKENFPWNQKWLFYLAQKSRMMGKLNFINFGYRENDMATTVRILIEIKKQTALRWKNKRFIVVFYPNKWELVHPTKFKAVLEKNGIEVLDLSQVDASNENYDLFFKMDGHPSPAGAYLYAWLLNKTLNLSAIH